MANRIGLLGGTFDPVHNGHISIFRSFTESDLIDQLWILLTPDPPHKADKNHAKYSDRLAMLHLAIEDLSAVSISTIEQELPKPSYTIQTIRALKDKHSDFDFSYCLGGDSLQNFHLWKNYDQILNEVDLLVAERPEFHHQNVSESILKKTSFIAHQPVSVSSSLIRERLNEGKSISDLVPQQVEDYILSEKLYFQ